MSQRAEYTAVHAGMPHPLRVAARVVVHAAQQYLDDNTSVPGDLWLLYLALPVQVREYHHRALRERLAKDRARARDTYRAQPEVQERQRARKSTDEYRQRQNARRRLQRALNPEPVRRAERASRARNDKRRTWQREYTAAHRGELTAKANARRAQRTPEQREADNARWREVNAGRKDKLAAWRRAHRAAHRDEINAREAERRALWTPEQREAKLAYWRDYNARRKEQANV